MIEALSLSSLFLVIFIVLFIVLFIAIGVHVAFDERKYKKGKVPFSKSLN